jgi:phospholipid-binding lipoprotein MlaA
MDNEGSMRRPLTRFGGARLRPTGPGFAHARVPSGGDGSSHLRRAALACGLLVAVLASNSARAQSGDDDPLEPLNRAVFQFNLVLDGLLLEPAARIYRGVTPEFFRTAVRNFIDNLRTPVVLANDIFQGEPYRAERTLGRFMLNTIMGVGGLVDVGGLLGMPERHEEDFGQTLAVYGVGEGPYLMLPFFGPSNPRDTAGMVVDVFLDPLNYIGPTGIGFFAAPTEIGLARISVEALATREQNIEPFEELKRSSIDLYAATRTLARQLRATEIRNGAPAPLDDIYDEDLYDFDDPEETDGP